MGERAILGRLSALLLTLAAMAAGPLLARLMTGRPRVEAFGDGLVQVAVGGLLLVHVVPFGLATAGWPAALALAAGIAGGVFAHRLPGAERAAGALAIVALVIHGLIDGAALAGEELLGWAVVLHTLPAGLATWRIGRARGGLPLAIGLLAASAISTTAGWVATEHLSAALPEAAFGVAQCLVAGALLHVLGHLGEGEEQRIAGVGALFGVLLVAVIGAGHPVESLYAEELGAGRALWVLLAASAPVLLVGYLVAGALHAFTHVPTSWLRRGPFGAALAGALLAVPVPVCSCGALPVYRKLLAQGAPAAAGLAFLVAGPELGAGALLMSVPLLGWSFTGVRALAAAVAAVAAGALVGRSLEPTALRPTRGEATWREAVRYGFGELVEHTAPWILAGLGVAALAEPLLDPDVLSRIPTPLAVIGAVVIGVPSYVCAAGATPLLAVLVHKGLAPGAALAFLIVGPAMNLTTLGALRRLHGPRVAQGFAVVVVAVALVVGFGVGGVPVPALHSMTPGPIAIVSAVVLIGVFAVSLVRTGPAGFLEPLVHPHHEHPHVHGPGCKHDHGPPPVVDLRGAQLTFFREP